MTMSAFGIVALIGAILGFRFNVLILFPAIGLAVSGAAVIEIARGDYGSDVLLSAVLIAAALQTGYFLGTVARSFAPFSLAFPRGEFRPKFRPTSR